MKKDLQVMIITIALLMEKNAIYNCKTTSPTLYLPLLISIKNNKHKIFICCVFHTNVPVFVAKNLGK